MGKFYIYIAIINLLDLLAVTSGKMWHITKNPLYLAISVILVAIVGHYVFKEFITGWQFAGIGFVLLGIVFLNIR